jgi:hypothetical protein
VNNQKESLLISPFQGERLIEEIHPHLTSPVEGEAIHIFSPLGGEIRVRGRVLNPAPHPHLSPLPSRERERMNYSLDL